MAQLLRATGEEVVTHDSIFEAACTDARWLAEAGQRGWVVLAREARIHTNLLERRGFLASGASVFLMAPGEFQAREVAQAYVAAMPCIKRARRWRRPLLATVSLDGNVVVHYVDRKKLARPQKVD